MGISAVPVNTTVVQDVDKAKAAKDAAIAKFNADPTIQAAAADYQKRNDAYHKASGRTDNLRHKGGPISKSGSYKLKAGEHVLTASETKKVKQSRLAAGLKSLARKA